MSEKENNQRHESTIDKYFSRTADGYNAWVDEDKEERIFLQIAAEMTGDTDEDGNQGFDFHFAYYGKDSLLADGIARAMQNDKFIRSFVLTAARKFLTNK